MNTIINANTGLPANVIQSGRNTVDPGLRPNLLRNPNLSRGTRTLDHYFDTHAFCTPTTDPNCPALGLNGVGNAPRNPLRGPGYVNIDYSAFKELRFKEEMRFELRFEFFNLFNTPHFSNPGTDLSDAGSYGMIRGAGSQRVMQFAAKFIF